MSGKPPVFKQTTEDSVFYKKVVKSLDAVMKSDNDHKKRHDAIENAFKQVMPMLPIDLSSLTTPRMGAL